MGGSVVFGPRKQSNRESVTTARQLLPSNTYYIYIRISVVSICFILQFDRKNEYRRRRVAVRVILLISRIVKDVND